MNEPQVKIVNLEALRVICFNGFGESPEGQALGKLLAWAQARGQHGRVFGFNNPDPSAGSPNYGYDVWMSVDQSVQPEGEARLIDFPGGLYAVLRCPVTEPGGEIPAAWQALVKWLDASEYRHDDQRQWLEEHLDPQNAVRGSNFTLDLYLPVKK
jgi:DNA gyrase inhibitor GyrI